LVVDISLSIPLLAFWYSVIALPIVLENEGKFFEPKKRMINTKMIMNHSAPAIFISIVEKINYDLPQVSMMLFSFIWIILFWLCGRGGK
jgi:hypothetical protein